MGTPISTPGHPQTPRKRKPHSGPWGHKRHGDSPVALPIPGSLFHQGDFHPPSILRNHSNTIKHRLSAGW